MTKKKRCGNIILFLIYLLFTVFYVNIKKENNLNPNTFIIYNY